MKLHRPTLIEVYRRWYAWYGGKPDAECFGDWLEQQLDPSFDPSREPLGRFWEKSAMEGTLYDVDDPYRGEPTPEDARRIEKWSKRIEGRVR